jgi:Na+-translocating ferredoxin:NAD+ oxidoreductase subunit A
MNLIGIAFGAVFVSNVVLAQFYGLCSFLGVSKKRGPALSMGAAVTLVITLSAIISWVIDYYILVPFNLRYLNTIVFILVIAAFVQLVEMLIKRFSPPLYQSLGVYLPLITTNCAVLGVAIDSTQQLNYNFAETATYAFFISIGYALVIYLFSAIREEMDAYDVPRNYQGLGVGLITAFILAMAFSGFVGVV